MMIDQMQEFRTAHEITERECRQGFGGNYSSLLENSAQPSLAKNCILTSMYVVHMVHW